MLNAVFCDLLMLATCESEVDNESDVSPRNQDQSHVSSFAMAGPSDTTVMNLILHSATVDKYFTFWIDI